jgi:tetratricopeptide (TPR) repeat protein
MPSFSPREDRHVVPRWRDPRVTAWLGELNSSSKAPTRPVDPAEQERLEDLRRSWQHARDVGEHRRAVSLALETAAFSVSHGPHLSHNDELAFLSGAPQLLSPAAERFVERLFAGRDEQHRLWLPPAPYGSATESHAHVRALKRHVRVAPRNALAWVELARQYIILGQSAQAQRAMRVARALSADNRFVLRSAARLHLVTGDADLAHQIIATSPATPNDPWLLAAELALAGEAGRAPKFTRRARAVLARDEAPPLHLSELASELATAELGAGKDRKARKLFQTALIDPHENGLAQVEWALPHLPLLVVDRDLLDVPSSYEARAREAAQDGRWKEALAESLQWLQDEPFSLDASTFASYVAATALMDYEAAERAARIGLAASPHRALLLNNLAFALAQQGRYIDAAAALREAAVTGDDADRAAVVATGGLVAYRTGDSALGRRLYETAIHHARTAGHRSQEALATFYLAMEELRLQSDDAVSLARRAAELARRQQAAEYKLLVQRLEAHLERFDSDHAARDVPQPDI